MKTLAIIGAGHLGQQIANYAISDNHYQNIVFFDDYCDASEINGFKVIGNINLLTESFQSKIFDEFLIGIGYNHMSFRKKIFNSYKKTIPIGEIIHSSCFIDETVKMKKGNVIYPNCTIEFNSNLGENILINIGCTIAHDSKINSHSLLSPRIVLSGFVSVGEMVNLGTNTTVINNIIINDKIQTGGGTVVIENLQKSGLYVGNPARFLKTISI